MSRGRVKTRKVTFIFIPREQEDQKTLTLHHGLYFLLKMLALLILLLIIVSYIILIPRARKYVQYEEKMESYRAQETQLRQLLEDVEKMKQFNTYIRELVGMELAPEYHEYRELAGSGLSEENGYYLSGVPELPPAKGTITKKFMSAPRRHYGVDIAGETGDPVLACADGLVVFAGWTPELGNMVVISHADNYITVYGHNDRLHVQERQRVKKGDLIALLGETGYSMGPHLHFEIWHKGEAVDPQKLIPEYKY